MAAFQSNFVQVGSSQRKIHYVEAGPASGNEAAPVVALHGLGGYVSLGQLRTRSIRLIILTSNMLLQNILLLASGVPRLQACRATPCNCIRLRWPWTQERVQWKHEH